MTIVRRTALHIALAAAAGLLAHGSGENGATRADDAATAFVALVAAAAACGAAAFRLTDGNRVVAGGAAALFAAHPTFTDLGRALEKAPPSSAATAAALFSVALGFAAIAVRRGPFLPAPPFRRDRRRRFETALYAAAAAGDPRLAVLPLVAAVADLWFHPDAPASWRRSTLRTALLQTGLAGVVATASWAISGRGWLADAGSYGFFAASGATLLLPRGEALEVWSVRAAWALCAAAVLPAGVLSRPGGRPSAVPLAIGLFGLFGAAGAVGAAALASECATLGAAGLALAVPVLAWRLAAGLTAPRVADDWMDEPLPSVPALRDPLRAARAAARADGAGASGLDAERIADAVRVAVADALDAARRAATAMPDPRWERLLAPDRLRMRAVVGAEVWSRYVREQLGARLRGVARVFVVGSPPPAFAAALAARADVELRPDPSDATGYGPADYADLPRVRLAAPGEDSGAARCDAAFALLPASRGPADVVRRLALLRRAVRRGGPVALIDVAEDGTPAAPLWDDLAEDAR